MAFSTADHDLYSKLYSKVLKEKLDYTKNKDTFARSMYQVEMTDTKTLDDTSLSIDEMLKPLGENQIAPLARFNPGYLSRIGWNRFGLANEVTFESLKTDRTGAIEREANRKAQSIMRTEDAYAGRIFRQAMNVSYAIADGRPLISASHPLRSGGVQSNTFATTQLPLTYDSLFLALDIMNQLKDQSGNLVTHGPKMTILIPNESPVLSVAFQLAGVNGPDMKPGTTNNDKNFFKVYEGYNFDVMVAPQLNLSVANSIGESTVKYTDVGVAEWQNRWFLIDRDALTENGFLAMVVLKGGDSLMKVLETETLAEKKLVYHHFGFGVRAGVSNWIFGSKGDGSATNF